MPHRRDLLVTTGAVAGAALVGTGMGTAQASSDRYILDTASTDERLDTMDVEVIYDYREYDERVHYACVRGPESALPSGATYASDVQIDRLGPAHDESSSADPREADEPLYDVQWDKREQNLDEAHDVAAGDGVRIGIIDSGVLGANPNRSAEHPDLPRVNETLSANFTGDGDGPGPFVGGEFNVHGTEVAGTAAAADNGVGLVGTAPAAEIVDLRVFSGEFAEIGDILAALLYGGLTAECDVVNLSLSTGLLPADNPDVQFFKTIYELIAGVVRGGGGPDGTGTLPVASAGNDGARLTDEVITLPANADGFLNVGATGPIGFGWPIRFRSRQVGPFEVEQPLVTELPTAEPAFYTNYGRVDVTAGGGNIDLDAIGNVDGIPFLDLVLTTGFAGPVDDPTPTYQQVAGTSFSAPNVAGLAALLKSKRPDATPDEIQAQIEQTARLTQVGLVGETTAPGATVNESNDGDFNGDGPSSPGANDATFDPVVYRNNGHVDVLTAVDEF